jgi:hypothetical protein
MSSEDEPRLFLEDKALTALLSGEPEMPSMEANPGSSSSA